MGSVFNLKTIKVNKIKHDLKTKRKKLLKDQEKKKSVAPDHNVKEKIVNLTMISQKKKKIVANGFLTNFAKE